MASLWVGTTDGLHVVGDEGAHHLSGHEVNALARGGRTTWALIDRHELWRHDGEWQHVTTVGDFRLNCLSPSGDELLVGTSEAHLMRLEGDALVPVGSFDDLHERTRWYTPWGGPPDVRSIARDDGRTFVNVHVGGILRSANDGSWEPTIDIGSDVHEVIALQGAVLAATAWGLGTSTDLGATWEFVDEGLHASYARAVTVVGDAVLMTASTGPHGGRAAIYRKPLADGIFEKLDKGLPDHFPDNIDTGCLAASRSDVAFATDDGRVYLSETQGDSWDQIAKDIGAARAVLFDQVS